MGIETEYRGYIIRYSENADEWNCYECGVSHVSLSKVKAKIDAMHLKLRKAAAVECLSISGYGSDAGAIPVTIIDYLGPRMERSGSFGTDRRIADQRVAIFAKRRGNDRASRSEADLSNLAFDTPEAREKLAEWKQHSTDAKNSERLAKEALEAIPRLTLADIDGLVKAASVKIEEGAE